jgi:hypothetical protein
MPGADRGRSLWDGNQRKGLLTEGWRVWNAANSREQCLLRGANIDRPPYRAASRKLRFPPPPATTTRAASQILHHSTQDYNLYLLEIWRQRDCVTWSRASSECTFTDILGFWDSWNISVQISLVPLGFVRLEKYIYTDIFGLCWVSETQEIYL